jgi:hypothetical protein
VGMAGHAPISSTAAPEDRDAVSKALTMARKRAGFTKGIPDRSGRMAGCVGSPHAAVSSLTQLVNQFSCAALRWTIRLASLPRRQRMISADG